MYPKKILCILKPIFMLRILCYHNDRNPVSIRYIEPYFANNITPLCGDILIVVEMLNFYWDSSAPEFIPTCG
jgi:hypothetical protein